MPSQEDYLDNLLKDMTAKEEKQEEDSVPEQGNSVDLDSVSNMTEEEIEQLLSAGAQPEEDTLFGVSDMELPDEDVLKMLEESNDSDLQEIQELLEKSDRNEAVDDSIEDLLREPAEEENPEAKILGESEDEGISAAEDKRKAALEKKKLARAKREEKKMQAAEKRAKKKAEKEAVREAKKQAREAKVAAREAKSDEKMTKSTENLFDTSVLDSIVADADKATADSNDAEELPPEAFVEEPVDVFAEEIDEPASEENEPEEAEDNLGIDLGSLFGEEDAEGSLSEEGEDSDFPDFVALDADEADALIPNHDEELAFDAAPKEKKGLFSKILDFLTEEDEEEENEDIKLSRENRDILNEMDNEAEEGKGKKGKKAKKAKEKKEKPEKEPKPKKAPKPKKEKPPKEVPLFPEKKLSLKKVIPVILIGISVGVLLFVFVNSAADFSDRKEARTAFYEGDYQTCYQNLFGKELDETESIMFGKSESILYIRLWIREYEMFAEEGSETEALDSLIQTVASYPDLYEYANQWNAGSEVAAGYAVVLNILADKYGLTESEAIEIAEEPDDVEYTKMVTAIAEGKSLDSWNEAELPALPEESQEPEESEESMQDILPEENELGKDTFIDNRKDGEAEE